MKLVKKKRNFTVDVTKFFQLVQIFSNRVRHPPTSPAREATVPRFTSLNEPLSRDTFSQKKQNYLFLRKFFISH